jgi:hypothetical protein
MKLSPRACMHGRSSPAVSSICGMGRGLSTINTENSPKKKKIELMEEFANQINAEIRLF